MNLSKRSIGLVMGLATIALVGLSVIQVRNLNSSIETNRQIFLQKVDLCSVGIGEQFSKNKTYGELLHQSALRVKEKGAFNDPIIDGKMRALIDDVFKDYSLDLPYEYAIYEHSETRRKEGIYNFVLGDQGTSLDFELTDCTNPDERGHSWTVLTCSNGTDMDGDYHLAVFFPSQNAYVFAQSSGALILSIVFILLLLFCFAYTLIVIQRQKKLSVIKNDFINNLTHEFKTPIASIALATSMLKRDSVDENEVKKANYLDLIEHEGKRLEGQVDKVLQIAMIDSGNFSLNKKLLNVHEAIKRVVESMSLVVSKRQGQIELDLKASQAEVMADETHLVNVIYNLVDNALKYTVDVPIISITTRDSEDGIEISIKDNGIGIGEEIQKYIFDKFYRAEKGNVHNVKGFGLGLSYVKNIIEAHSGKIGLSSEINRGSEFRMYFPFT
ncbi:sensor histidine kinase KdpD [Roseivirga sp. E12]|uniref:sensor histidine kinase n=1 Tax=Roseivirga sp. E12 TaxID=2819237 RepID=UPI001ABC30EC|nr:HAMP domain-containing sensor histidine kinase [Roseivirga sp. E12]MBO3698056.1 HAMP domain-containing histidine kinase [Roseivirga sp. E12]